MCVRERERGGGQGVTEHTTKMCGVYYCYHIRGAASPATVMCMSVSVAGLSSHTFTDSGSAEKCRVTCRDVCRSWVCSSSATWN